MNSIFLYDDDDSFQQISSSSSSAAVREEIDKIKENTAILNKIDSKLLDINRLLFDVKVAAKLKLMLESYFVDTTQHQQLPIEVSISMRCFAQQIGLFLNLCSDFEHALYDWRLIVELQAFASCVIDAQRKNCCFDSETITFEHFLQQLIPKEHIAINLLVRPPHAESRPFTFPIFVRCYLVKDFAIELFDDNDATKSTEFYRKTVVIRLHQQLLHVLQCPDLALSSISPSCFQLFKDEKVFDVRKLQNDNNFFIDRNGEVVNNNQRRLPQQHLVTTSTIATTTPYQFSICCGASLLHLLHVQTDIQLSDLADKLLKVVFPELWEFYHRGGQRLFVVDDDDQQNLNDNQFLRSRSLQIFGVLNLTIKFRRARRSLQLTFLLTGIKSEKMSKLLQVAVLARFLYLLNRLDRFEKKVTLRLKELCQLLLNRDAVGNRSIDWKFGALSAMLPIL